VPTIGGRQEMLSAAASYAAGEWLNAGAAVNLDVAAGATFHRGLDLNLGAEALIQLDGAVQHYFTAEVSGQAHAAARVRAQVQVPLDLFSEAGLAVRLQAVAEAAAGVSLNLGLSVGDFLALAEADPRMRGVPLLLLRVFLDELEISGGVMAKAAAAAMAYANVALTGRLLPGGVVKPGFSIMAEAGVGLKAGAGFRVQATLGIDDPRRLLRRTVDVCVDESLRSLEPVLPADVRWICGPLRVPAKIALRAAYELGLALAPAGATASTEGPTLAVRCVQVALEEVQREVLEWAVAHAAGALRVALRDTGFSDERWQACRTQRQALADRLAALPADPFEPTTDNRDYWLVLVHEAIAVATALSADRKPSARSARLLATIWSASQLLFVVVERISQANARASILGRPAAQVSEPFTDDLLEPPDEVRTVINAEIGSAATAAVSQREAVQFLLAVLKEALEGELPDWADIVMMVVGPHANGPARALDVVFANLGAFVPAAPGRVSPAQTLSTIRDGLQAYVDARVERELRPALLALTGDDRALGLYADEVVLGTLRTVVRTVLGAVVRAAQGESLSRDTVRELCSSLIMSLFGRSLVVTGDVLLDHALRGLRGELRGLADHVDDAGGVAEVLAGLTRLDRAFVAEVIEETLLVAADTFAPFPEERRAQMRDLLYRIIDTAPTADGGDPVAALADSAFIPNGEAAVELARLLGSEIGGNLVRFIQALLTRVGGLILDELAEAIAEVGRAVAVWLLEIEDLARSAAQRVMELLDEIGRLGAALEEAGDRLLDDLSALLRRLDEHGGSRTALREAAREIAVGEALKSLRANQLYSALPRELRRPAEDAVDAAVRAVLQAGVFDPVLDAVADVADEVADFLDDLRGLEPGTALPEQVMELFLDRLEDAVRDVFGGSNPGLDVSITVPVVNWEIDLGRVRVPLGQLLAGLRGAARGLQGIRARVDAVAAALADAFSAEADLRAAEAEHQLVAEQKLAAERRVAEARLSVLDVQILRPAPGGAETGALALDLLLPGVPRSFVQPENELDAGRLFVWVNQRLLHVEGVEVDDLDAPSPPAPVAVARQPGGTGTYAHPLLRGRFAARAAASLSTSGRGRRSASARRILARPGGQARNSGRALGTTLNRTGSMLPGRTLRSGELHAVLPVGTAGVRVAVPVPGAMLREGINTVVVVLAPGPAERRLERTVTFLWSPTAPAGSGVPVVPGRLVWNATDLSDMARVAVESRLGPAAFGRAGSGRPAPPGDRGVPVEATEMRLPPSDAMEDLAGPDSGRYRTLDHRRRDVPSLVERRRAVTASRAQLATRLGAAPDRVRAMREAVVRRAFRPVTVPVRRDSPRERATGEPVSREASPRESPPRELT
jgi:hypothetical protein